MKVYIYGCQKGWQLKAKAMVTILFWSDSVFGLSFADGKSAIAYIFGFVGWTEIILTSNRFLYQAPTYFSVFSQLCSACSVLGFWAVLGSWRVNKALTSWVFCLILFVCPWYNIQSWKKHIFSLRAYQKLPKFWISVKNQKM